MMRPVELASVGIARDARALRATLRTGGNSFADVLAQEAGKSNPVRFSRHASERMGERRIALTPAQETRLAQAVDEAAAKGGRESLVVMGDVAMVVSVPNRTVITAVPANELSHQVFTNIDSAVVVPQNERPPLPTL